MIKLDYQSFINDYAVIFLLISLAAGIISLFYYLKIKKEIDSLQLVHEYNARELRLLCSGNFNAVVQIKGYIDCKNPLISPIAKIPCCWYKITIQKVSQQNKRAMGSDEIYVETKSTLFKVCDDTGYILVDPTGADIDSVQVGYEEIDRRKAESITNTSLDNLFGVETFRTSEYVLVDAGTVYVTGNASSVQMGTFPDVVINNNSASAVRNPNRFRISRNNNKNFESTSSRILSVCRYLSAISFILAAYFYLYITGIIRF